MASSSPPSGPACLVLGLNYVYEGLRPPQADLLWREPNAHRRGVYSRLWRFLVACDSRQLPPGRSGPESLSFLFELEFFAGALAQCGSGYPSSAGLPSLGLAPSLGETAHHLGSEHVAEECSSIPRLDHDHLPQLQPYRLLDTGRLKLTGRGAWAAEPWLQGLFWLPFVEA